MRWLNQIVAITLMNLRNIPQRLGTSLVVVVGIAGVVGVLVSVLAMAEGFKHTLASTGRADRVLLLRAGSDAELNSGIARDQADLAKELDGLAHDNDGMVVASRELMLIVDLPRKGETDPSNVPMRGVEPSAFTVRDELKMIAGRRFNLGVREVVVGKRAAAEFAGLEVGAKIAFRDSDWTVVGIFETGGDVHETEVWADSEVVMSAFRRQGYQSITAKLADSSEAGLATLNAAIAANPRLAIKAWREPEYYAKQAGALATLINVLGYTVAVFMAIGALFGALNCMYSAIVGRQVEIGTLRALGFSAGPVVVSVMVEALLLATVGGILGGALAYVYCNGATLSTLNWNTFSQVAFDFRVTLSLLIKGLVWALVIGLIGGLFPALRAARLPVTAALRAA